MKRWLFLLAGPLLWAAHFTAAYAIASLSIQFAGEMTATARWIAIAVSIMLAALVVLFGWPRRPSRPFDQFLDAVRIAGCVIGGFGILWQTLPLFLR